MNCKKCGEELVTIKTRTYCRACNTERLRKYREANRNKVNEYGRKRHLLLKEQGKKYIRKPNIPRICLICNKDFLAYREDIKQGGALTCSRQCFHIRYGQITKNAKRGYRGSKAGIERYEYDRRHRWIKNELGPANKCENCGKTEGFIDWSNKTGQYLQDTSDWQMLCRSCHKNYDHQLGKRNATMKTFYDTLKA